MKYLPFEKLTYKTSLASEEILKRLRENIEPKKTFRMTGLFGSKDHKHYEGSIEGRSFSISRIIHYRNSFLPIIKGEIASKHDGTHIHIQMRLHTIALIFMALWCGILGLVFLVISFDSLNEGSFDPFLLIPLGMLLFGYLMTVGGFKYESGKSKKWLKDLFEAAEIAKS